MPPRKKGRNSETKVRMTDEFRTKIRKLAQLHDTSENDEMNAAIAAYIRNHDPATCGNVWCEARRAKK
jgi:hypothetical protein